MLTFFLSSIWYKWPHIIRKWFCVLSPHFPLVWWSVVPCWPDSISRLCQSKIWCWQTKHPKDYTKLRLSTDVYFPSVVDNVVLSTSWSCSRTLLSATSFSLPSETGSVQSCPILCDSMDGSLPGSSVHRILLARILEWVCHSLLQGSSWPRDQTQVSCIAGGFFTMEELYYLLLLWQYFWLYLKKKKKVNRSFVIHWFPKRNFSSREKTVNQGYYTWHNCPWEMKTR